MALWRDAPARMRVKAACIPAHAPLRVVQVSFHADERERDAETLLESWPTLLGTATAVARAGAEVTVVQAASRHQTVQRDGVTFRFVHDPAITDGRSSRFILPPAPRRIIATVSDLRPDVVHVQGMPFALATRRLASALPSVPVLVQDHASAPPRMLRALAWRWCYRSLDGLVVASGAQSEAFRSAHVLPRHTAVFEVIEGSTGFTPGDQVDARRATGLFGDPCVLWTGHLDANKDPLSALEAFGRAAPRLPDARLFCCFTSAPLRDRVEQLIAGDPMLRERVVLCDRRAANEMEQHYRAADFFLQMSHREGCSYSAIEALACGTTPLVTDIASNRRIVGAAGSLTPVGDAVAMADAMVDWARRDRRALRRQARARFESALSYDVIGRDLYAAYEALARRA